MHPFPGLVRWIAVAALVASFLVLPAVVLAAEGEASSNIPKLVNFTILAGLLVVLLRKPLANFLDAKAQQIRDELEASRADRAAAAAARELAEARDTGRDAEAERTRARITESAVEEGQRIIAAAEEQAKKITAAAEAEVEAEVRNAERRLTAAAARAAVRVTRERLRTGMTDEDHSRLIHAGIEAIRSER